MSECNSSPVLFPSRHNRLVAIAIGIVAGACLLASTGCVVPQPRGDGQLERIVEPSSGRGYWRYLPRDYAKGDDAARRSRRWPVVVSFHGMKPFDNALPQALEWEAEADRYGYIVIAPELDAPDVLAQFPVRTVHHAFKADEDASLVILDHLFATTQADPSNVLSTSWSSGGYMAHYMLNRHPDRFTCLAVRQSNFSSSVLDGSMTSRSQYHPVLIINTQNDFAICKKESKEARDWYQGHGYQNMAWVVIRSLGHERTPDMAADYFGQVAGVHPSSPPMMLVERQAIDGNTEGLAFFAGQRSNFKPAPDQRNTFSQGAFASANRPQPVTPPRPRLVQTEIEPDLVVRGLPRNQPAPELSAPTPQRAAAVPARDIPRRDPLSIRVSSAIGIEPLHLSFSAECPLEWYDSASFLWTLDGASLSDGVNGQKTLADAGEHTLAVLVVTNDGQEHRASRTIRVIPRINASASTGRN